VLAAAAQYTPESNAELALGLELEADFDAVQVGVRNAASVARLS
jgi:hypothetical protein